MNDDEAIRSKRMQPHSSFCGVRVRGHLCQFVIGHWTDFWRLSEGVLGQPYKSVRSLVGVWGATARHSSRSVGRLRIRKGRYRTVSNVQRDNREGIAGKQIKKGRDAILPFAISNLDSMPFLRYYYERRFTTSSILALYIFLF